MGRSRAVIRRLVMRPTRRNSNGVEGGSDLARDARFVFQRSIFRKLYGVPLPPASERAVVARCDDITDGFQRLGPCEFISPTRGTQARRAVVAIRFELMGFELPVKAVQHVG
jgi:hypothetical protein